MIIRNSFLASAIASILCVLFLYSCSKKSDLPFSAVPEIKITAINSTSIKQFEDSLIISLAYQDGDGNIGFEESDSFALIIRDIRLATDDKFHISPLAPIGESIAIKGVIRVPIGKLFLFGTSNTESTRFILRLKDRAGNWSNEVETESILISK
jgi:hypothetical protein